MPKRTTFMRSSLQQLQKTFISEICIILGDWNGHIGKSSAGYEGVHGVHGWGTRNTEDERLLEFAVSCNLIIGNTCFRKPPNHPITFTSGKGRTQIDYVLLCKTFHKHARDVKIIPGEEIAKQHHLLVCDFRVNIPPPLIRNSSLAWGPLGARD